MTSLANKTTPTDTLASVEREFDAGNYAESARLLWEATQATFLMLGKAHRLPTTNVRDIGYALDERYALD